METLAFYCRLLYEFLRSNLDRPWAELAFLFAAAQTAMVVFLPWLCVITMFRLAWIRRDMRELAVRLDRVQDNLFDLRKVSDQVARSLAGDSTVRFGPEGNQISGSTSIAEPEGTAAGEGRGSYNFCNNCKVIRFIKFSRCQTCGYHVA